MTSDTAVVRPHLRQLAKAGKRAAWAGVLGMAVATIAACGGDSEGATTSTVTVAPTTTVQTGADWKYLQTQYSALLSRECGEDADPGGVWRACVGLQHVDMESLYRDAQTLPMSKARTDLLRAIEEFQEDYDKWTENMCGMGDSSDVAKNVECQLLPLQMSFRHETVRGIINNNAGT
ncbi:MAG: hypothetical protein K2X52_23840 [Mycobacteriaceae bacterium]|nr:hypothetical protein [Mycobacteriaceae bacterium]